MLERLSLLVPGLLAPVREGESRHPVHTVDSAALRQLLSACRQRRPADLAALLSRHVGACHWQDAAAVAKALALPAAGAWLFAAPVWLRPEHSGIYLLGSRPLQLTLAEAGAFAAELNSWLQQDGMQLYPVTPDRWLLALPDSTGTQWSPLAQSIGRDLRQLAPQGEAGLRWQSRLTEWQMLLNQSPLNQARQQRGLPPVHSLWLWGNHASSATDLTARHAVLGEPSLLTLANPAAHRQLEALLQHHSGQATVIDERVQDAFVHGDVAGYQIAYQNFMTETLAPLQQAVALGRIAELQLYPDDGFVYPFSAKRHWQFWQRAPLPDLLRAR